MGAAAFEQNHPSPCGRLQPDFGVYRQRNWVKGLRKKLSPRSGNSRGSVIFRKGISNVSHKYDTVSRAATRKLSRETNIVSPEMAKLPGAEPLNECDSTCTDCAELKLCGNFDNDVARIPSVIFASLVSVVFFFAPLAYVLYLLWRQASA